MADYTRMIDVSVYQGNIDWATVSKNIDAAILRIGISVREGGALACYKDKCFDKNYAGAKANGVPIGVYYYSHAYNVDEAKKEAEYVIGLLKDHQFEFPIYYDVEEKSQFALGKKATSDIIRKFLSTVEEAGYWVGLYTGYYAALDYVEEDIRSRYAFWLAHWGVDKSPYKGEYGIWQYSEKGSVAGISDYVDLDKGFVDYPSKIKEAGLNGFSNTPQPEPETEPAFVNPYPLSQRMLKKGDKGDDVKWVQYNLEYLKYDIGKYGVDGDFGKVTDAAVRKFQSDHKLGVDGIVGPQTKSVMIMLTNQTTNGFTPRMTRPEAGNKYYITKASGGWSTAIKGNPTDSVCDVLSNCVGYAFGRVNEIAGDTNMSLLRPLNAENFYDVALEQGLTISNTPKLGAVMCWQKGSTRSYQDGAGHVAVVEQIVSDTEVVTSESGYGCSNPFWIQTRKKGNGNWGAGSDYKFLGFILNPAVK